MYLPSESKIREEVSRDKFIRKPQFWLPILGGLLIILCTPDNIFQQLSLLEQFAKIISDQVPSINTWVERSAHPMTTRLLFSYCWMLTPYYAWTFYNKYFNRAVDNRKLQLWSELGWKRHFIPVWFILVFAPIMAIFYFFALPAEPNCTRLCIHESLMLQLLFTFCLTLSISFFFSFMYFWLKNFRKFHFLKI